MSIVAWLAAFAIAAAALGGILPLLLAAWACGDDLGRHADRDAGISR